MQLRSEYMEFFVMGLVDDLTRSIRRSVKTYDYPSLADKVMKGTNPHELAREVAVKLAAPLTLDREKREWLEQHAALIGTCGGDKTLAHEHFMEGVYAEMAADIEGSIFDTMTEEDDDGDDDDDDDDDDDGDDD